jgi:hypothetical protein
MGTACAAGAIHLQDDSGQEYGNHLRRRLYRELVGECQIDGRAGTEMSPLPSRRTGGG